MIGLAFDPGKSTGICRFFWDEVTPFRLVKAWQITGGAAGLRDWIHQNHVVIDTTDVFLSEKFTPRNNRDFALTLDSVEPLRCEGVYVGLGLDDRMNWAQPSQQYFIGSPGLTPAKKKWASREFLKKNGIHLTGKVVGGADADDAISATLHAIAYLRRIRHMPTLVEMFGPGVPGVGT